MRTQIIIGSVLAIFLAACGDDSRPVGQYPGQPTMQQPAVAAGQPVIINQTAPQSNGVLEMAAGATAGYMLSQAINNRPAQQAAVPPTVIEKRIYINRTAAPVAQAPAKALATPQVAAVPKNVPAAIIPKANPTWSTAAVPKFSGPTSYATARVTTSSGKR